MAGRNIMLVLAALCCPMAALAQAPLAFQCPLQGVSVEYDTGTRSVFGGPDPTDSAICLVRTGTNDRRMLYAFWTLPLSHNDAERSARAGLAQLYPATVGKASSFELFLPRAGGGDDPYRETWRVLRFEPVTVRAGTLNAMVIERVQEGQGTNTFKGTWTRWIDVNSRVVIKQTFELGRGRMPANQQWEATALRVPPPAQPAPRPRG